MVQSRDDYDNDDEPVIFLSSRGDKNKALHYRMQRSNKMHACIKEKKWQKVIELLHYRETDSRIWIEENNEDGSRRWKSLPIHLTCEYKPPADVVAELLRSYPESVRVKNYGGDLPIHVACREAASKDIVDLILENEYESTNIPDCEGRLPLHLAASNNEIDIKIVKDLIDINEKATRTPDDFGLMPLHWACSKNASPLIIESLIQAYPYAVEFKDSWGRTPISLAQKSSNAEKAKVIELLSRNAASWAAAMRSTIVDLSNQVLESDRIKQECDEHAKQCRRTIEKHAESQKEVEYLEDHIFDLEEHFEAEVESMKRGHEKELEGRERRNEHSMSEVKKKYQESERKSADLKVLVDELVENLRKQKEEADSKEASRKEFKEKAVALIKCLDEEKQKGESSKVENKRLKAERKELLKKIIEKDALLEKLQDSFQKPIDLLNRTNGGGTGTGTAKNYHSYARKVEERDFGRAGGLAGLNTDRSLADSSESSPSPSNIFECERI